MLSDNIKNLRIKNSLSQEELAEKLHVVRQTVSKWENALSVPDADMLCELGRVFGVPVGELLGEKIPEESPSAASLAAKLEELNEQLARQKRRQRRAMRVAAGLFLASAFCFLVGAVHPYVVGPVLMKIMSGGQNIAVIGGADGPTSIYVAAGEDGRLWVNLALAAAAAAVGAMLIKKSSRDR